MLEVFPLASSVFGSKFDGDEFVGDGDGSRLFDFEVRLPLLFTFGAQVGFAEEMKEDDHRNAYKISEERRPDRVRKKTKQRDRDPRECEPDKNGRRELPDSLRFRGFQVRRRLSSFEVFQLVVLVFLEREGEIQDDFHTTRSGSGNDALDAFDDGLEILFWQGLSGVGDVDFVFEGDPAFATGVGEGVFDVDGVGEFEGADDDEVEGFFGAVVEAHVDEGGVPEVEVGELVDFGAGGGGGGRHGDFEDSGDFAVAADFDFVGFGGEMAELGAALRLGHFGILVDKGGVEEEAFVLEFEFVVGFEDAALAEEEGLAAGEEV